MRTILPGKRTCNNARANITDPEDKRTDPPKRKLRSGGRNKVQGVVSVSTYSRIVGSSGQNRKNLGRGISLSEELNIGRLFTCARKKI